MQEQLIHRSPFRERLIGLAVGLALFGVAALVGATPGRAPESADPAVAEFVSLIPDLVPFELRPDLNERGQYWRERFTTDRRRDFEGFLAGEARFASLIRDELRARQMPEELLYLAMLESGFSVNARSAVSATGVWQFMGPTAREYGLRIDEWVDERRDPVRATQAALTYLEVLHDRFGSWYLAAAAYNAGPGRVSAAVRRVAGRTGDPEGVDPQEIYWEVLEQLPSETREYVPRLIAAMVLAKQQGHYGFAASEADPYVYDRVWVPGGTSLRTLSAALGTGMEVLRDLNPHLIRGITPPGEPFELRIPVGQSQRVVSAWGVGAGFGLGG